MQEPKRGGCLRNADQAIRMHVPYADCSLGLERSDLTNLENTPLPLGR